MFVLVWQFLKRFFFDATFAAARLRTVFAAIAGSGYTFAPDLAEAIGDPKATGWIKLGAGLLGVIAFAIKAGEKNDDAEAIAEKLRSVGYVVTKVGPVPAPGGPAEATP